MATPTVEDLVADDGVSGIYDKLLASNKKQIRKEFEGQRISKTDYATVLMSTLESTMQMSMQFLLERDKIELMEAQIALTTKQGQLIDAQIAESVAKEALTAAQVLQVEQETEKLEWDTAAAKGLTDAVDVKVDSLMSHQILKAQYDSETSAARANSERAQTNGSGIDITSVIGRQNEIYKQQAVSYIKDAKIKASQQMVDAWKVTATTEYAPPNSLLISTSTSGVNHVLAAVESMNAAVNS